MTLKPANIRDLTDEFLDLLAALVVENPNDGVTVLKTITAEVKRRANQNKTRPSVSAPEREVPTA